MALVDDNMYTQSVDTNCVTFHCSEKLQIEVPMCVYPGEIACSHVTRDSLYVCVCVCVCVCYVVCLFVVLQVQVMKLR